MRSNLLSIVLCQGEQFVASLRRGKRPTILLSFFRLSHRNATCNKLHVSLLRLVHPLGSWTVRLFPNSCQQVEPFLLGCVGSCRVLRWLPILAGGQARAMMHFSYTLALSLSMSLPYSIFLQVILIAILEYTITPVYTGCPH